MKAIDGILMGIGGMVGGGIFILNGVSVVKAGKYGPISWLIGLVLCLLIAFSYCILAEEYPSKGGTIDYPEQLLEKKHDRWKQRFSLLVILGYVILTSVYSLGLSNYLAEYLGIPQMTSFLAMIIICLGLIINYFPKKVFLDILNSLVYGKLFIFLAVVFIGLWLEGPNQRGGMGRMMARGMAQGMGGASEALKVTPYNVVLFGISSFLSYEGFEMISNMSDTMENRKFNIPLSFMVSLVVTALIYSCLSYVTHKHMGGDINHSNMYSSFHDLVQKFGLGRLGVMAILLLSILANFSAINATFFTNDDIWTSFFKFKNREKSSQRAQRAQRGQVSDSETESESDNLGSRLDRFLQKGVKLPFFQERRKVYLWVTTLLSCLFVLFPQLIITNLGSLSFFAIFAVISYMGVLLVRKKEKEKGDVLFFGRPFPKRVARTISYSGLVACLIGVIILIIDLFRKI